MWIVKIVGENLDNKKEREKEERKWHDLIKWLDIVWLDVC